MGRDFYGRPTEAVFFHIPERRRRRIILLLLLAVILHLAHQALRIVYPTYEQSEDGAEGQPPLLLTFFPSVACNVIAGALQACELHQLQQADPTRFPPSALAQAGKHAWQQLWNGRERNCCRLLSSSLREVRDLERRAKDDRSQRLVERRHLEAHTTLDRVSRRLSEGCRSVMFSWRSSRGSFSARGSHSRVSRSPSRRATGNRSTRADETLSQPSWSNTGTPLHYCVDVHTGTVTSVAPEVRDARLSGIGEGACASAPGGGNTDSRGHGRTTDNQGAHGCSRPPDDEHSIASKTDHFRRIAFAA